MQLLSTPFYTEQNRTEKKREEKRKEKRKKKRKNYYNHNQSVFTFQSDGDGPWYLDNSSEEAHNFSFC